MVEVRNYGKVEEVLPIPSLVRLQADSYDRFLDEETSPEKRSDDKGLEAVFKDFFPVTAFEDDEEKSVSVTYHGYSYSPPQHDIAECRDLGLTFQKGLKLKIRVEGGPLKDAVLEEGVHVAYMPIRVGGGEFIINGCERTIVTQIQRSPGVDFTSERTPTGRFMYSCRIIPERGSWIQIETTTKDLLQIKIDKTTKVNAITFLRAFSSDYGTNEQVLRAFFDTKVVKLSSKKVAKDVIGKMLITDIIDEESGEPLLRSCDEITEVSFETMRGRGIKEVEIITTEDLAYDDIFLNTLRDDDVFSHEEALLKIYKKLRPGSPADEQKVKELFYDRFMNESRYNFGDVGRFRINRKLELEGNDHTLTCNDYLSILRYLLLLIRTNGREGEIDDIDHLGNRRIRPISDLLADEMRSAMLKLRRSVKERMVRDIQQDQEATTILAPRALFNSQALESSVLNFFQRGELSQVVDQSNLLSQLTHERRLSALGPGGLNRKRAGFEVRDVHTSHYGRICPIETPEGANIGLIVSMSLFSSVNEHGFLITPYHKVTKGKVSKEVEYMMADEEAKVRIGQASVSMDINGKIETGRVQVRYQGEFEETDSDKIEYLDVSTKQMLGVSASLIPFLEHDDANRALMGANMMRQAVPLLIPAAPIVGTGLEMIVPRSSSMIVTAPFDGVISQVDCTSITVKGAKESQTMKFRKYNALNERTCLNQQPIVKLDDKVTKDQVLSDGGGTDQGELALGKNIFVAFMSYHGKNFEDAIIVNERLLAEDTFTSIHIEEFKAEIRETKLGKEEFTREIPGRSEEALRKLDERGFVQVGTSVGPGDILVGKVTPKNKSELSAEEKLLHAIFGRAGEDVRDDSLVLKPGVRGVVVDVKKFRRRAALTEKDKQTEQKIIGQLEKKYDQKRAALVKEKFTQIWAIGSDIVNIDTGEEMKFSSSMSDAEMLELEAKLPLTSLNFVAGKRRKAKSIYDEFEPKLDSQKMEFEKECLDVKRGDDLQTGVLEMVKVYVARKLTLKVGDKMAGRHGNKGVISTIVPEEDMPFLPNGETIDIILNPLGVPSRMNVGQVLETHLGWAARVLGIHTRTPVFDGATEEEVKSALREARLPVSGKTYLYDGLTGERFHQKTTVGVMYMLKLHHLVEDKLHARATGPYSLITQQPLGGKARFGGQRFGEMEVWALEAYGAANVLQEILTVKSDDVDGRTRIYESIVKGDGSLTYGTPMAFEVLINEIRGLGLDIRLHRPDSMGFGDASNDSAEDSLSFGITEEKIIEDVMIT